jgi:hypothetical protein
VSKIERMGVEVKTQRTRIYKSAEIHEENEDFLHHQESIDRQSRYYYSVSVVVQTTLIVLNHVPVTLK